MRKEKRGHARGTDDRGWASARGRPQYDGDATGWRGRWQRKRDGRLHRKKRKRLRGVGTMENREVGFGSSSCGKGLKDF
jgi:hypothetical protein